MLRQISRCNEMSTCLVRAFHRTGGSILALSGRGVANILVNDTRFSFFFKKNRVDQNII